MHNIILALRNLSRQKRRSFLLGGAIAFGILIVTLVNGVAGGLARNLEQNFAQLLGGEIFIQGVQKTSSGQRLEVINDDAALAAAVEASRIPVRSITRSSNFLATFIFHNNTAVQEVVGVDFEQNALLRGRLSSCGRQLRRDEEPQRNHRRPADGRPAQGAGGGHGAGAAAHDNRPDERRRVSCCRDQP